jgi:hypothetical protein
MLFNRTPRPSSARADDADQRRLMADLELAQRRDIYAAGPGDGDDRSRRRRTKRALRRK